MIVPCKQLVCVVILEDGSNNYEASTLKRSPQCTTEYPRMHQYSQTPQYGRNQMFVPYNQLVHMVIVEDSYNN
jgi:hypothetical protein